MQRSTLRASDGDREAVAERLRNAAAEGRLLAHELEERIARALRARTYGELDAVVADLPAIRGGSRPAIPLLRPALAVAIVLAAVLVIALAVLVITGFVAVWALWALGAWWLFGGRHRRHLRRGAQLRVGRQTDRRAWL
jgi:hypothetical protein